VSDAFSGWLLRAINDEISTMAIAPKIE